MDTLNPRGSHPILELIERAKRLASELEAKRHQVTSLQDAVDDYRRSFGMMPPEGFEDW
jgi:beta-1,2-xylosyltransferase